MSDDNKDLLRFLTCGSVDDGKSTLLGRLLYDSKKICRDQLLSLKSDSEKHGTTGKDNIDYALLLDGLKSEREQGITIDVAYRYFETPRRKFIVADTPGHEQYTRNMVTGASTADLAIILIDAGKGVVTQTKRHAFIVSLLQIPHLVVAVNKMDLVDYSKEVFDSIVEDFKAFASRLEIRDIEFLPVSALEGDNVVTKSKKMPWHEGEPILHYLEDVRVGNTRNLVDFRFPVQYVLRPNAEYRGFAGRVESGKIALGEPVVTFPSGKQSTVKAIDLYDRKLESAEAGQSVVIRLNDELDISRGDIIVREKNLPDKSSRFDAMLCWMSESPMNPNGQYILKHTTKTVNALIEKVIYVIDVNTLHRIKTDEVKLNDIARLEINTTSPLFFDPYNKNRKTGSFILIDVMTNQTVAAGMIRGRVKRISEIKESLPKSDNINIEHSAVELSERLAKNGHKTTAIWLTGLSGSGKSTLGRALERSLFDIGLQVRTLDGDNVRHGLCKDLGFSPEDRAENIRRVGETAKLFAGSGIISICSFISPYRVDRGLAREIFQAGEFIEVYVKCDINECRRRDPKGLYAKVDAGLIQGFTGVDAPYEEPETPEIVIDTAKTTVEDGVAAIINLLKDKGIIS